MIDKKEGQVIRYIDSWAWGVAPDGRTVCLGAETDIRAILANPRRHPSNPTIAQVIGLERQLTGLEKTPKTKDPLRIKRRLRRRAKKAGISVGEQRELEKKREEKEELKYKSKRIVKPKLSRKKTDLCPVCQKRKATSPHHIKPREEGGGSTGRNIVYLCPFCHDVVEEYGSRGKTYSLVLIELIRLEGRIPE